MNKRASFLDELRKAEDARQKERLRPGAVHRIARRLDAELLQTELPSRRRRAFIPMMTFAAGAAMVLAVFTFGDGPDRAERTIEANVPMHASWQVIGGNCHATRGEAELTLDGSCRVQTSEPGLTIESRKTTRLRAVKHGVELTHGVAMFEVEPVTEGPPWRVEVPGGAIEVMGTRFSVVVDGDQGHVDLLEGSIHFVGTDGQVHEIEPGERFRFAAHQAVAAGPTPSDNPTGPTGPTIEPPLAAGERLAQSSEVAESDDGPLAAGERLAALANKNAARTRGRTGPATDSEELRRIVAEVAQLRAQRKYKAAASQLREALSKRLDRHAREVLSYELGTILSTHLPDRDKACAHWDEHQRRFPSGDYQRAIERARGRLSCP